MPCPAQNPELPSPASASAGHILAAAVLSIVIVGIYGPIMWGNFINNPDFRVHLDIARRFLETGRPYAPHFLFHGLTAALFAMHLAPSLLSAGRWVMISCNVLMSLLLYYLLWSIFQRSSVGRPSILFAAGLATLLAQPITLAHAYALGYFWPEPYQIPTSTLLKPFALAGFACTAWYLSRRTRVDLGLAVLFSVATVAGSLSKPSFLICVAPAAAALAVYRLIRRLPVSVAGLLIGLYLPAAAVLGWQFYATYSGQGANGVYHDSIVWAPFKFMRHFATGLPSKFFFTISFPLVVTILYWKQARRDTMLQLAWSSFLIGAFYSYMLVEKINWATGNLTWSGGITAFTLLVGSVVFWLRQISYEPSARWYRQRVLLCGAVLALHVISGVRMDWLYLTHYGCLVDYFNAAFVCGT